MIEFESVFEIDAVMVALKLVDTVELGVTVPVPVFVELLEGVKVLVSLLDGVVDGDAATEGVVEGVRVLELEKLVLTVEVDVSVEDVDILTVPVCKRRAQNAG